MHKFKLLMVCSLILSYTIRAMDYEYTDSPDSSSSSSSNQAVVAASSSGAEILQNNLEVANATSQQCTQTQAKLDRLASVEIGLILCQLNNQVGTKGFINKKDIAVVIKNVHNLARVNRQLYASVNNYIATNLLINSLAERFKMSPVDIAVLIKTKATQKWLKEYVQKTGDYELFKVVQNIFAICREISEQVKQYGISATIGYEDKLDNEANPCHNQTRQGLMLKCNMYPQVLCTPWGQLTLFHDVHSQCLKEIVLQHEFLKRVIAYFESVRESMFERDWLEPYELVRPIDLDKIKEFKFEDVFKKISKEAVKAKIGQQALITGKGDGISTYKIRAVGSTLLPDPEMLPKEEYRSYTTVKAIWKIMDDMFHNRNEQSQVAAPSSSSYSYKQESRIYPDPYQIVPSVEVANINDIPAQYAQLAQRLIAQPLFTGRRSFVKQSKVITCESWDDCRITELLIQSANKHLSKEMQWHIQAFGRGNSQLYIGHQCLGNGLDLWIYENNNPCPIGILTNHFTVALNNLKGGWEQSTLIENQDILILKSEEEWFLFIKKATESDENLISWLASKLGLHKKISCQSDWHNEKKHENEMYLWVRKDAIDEVRNVIGLHI